MYLSWKGEETDDMRHPHASAPVRFETLDDPTPVLLDAVTQRKKRTFDDLGQNPSVVVPGAP